MQTDVTDARSKGARAPYLDRTLGAVAAIILLCLVLVTCIDVVGRYLLNEPLKGAFEMTELMLVALVFSALPLTTARREHVEVDLLTAVCGSRVDRWLTLGSALFSAALLVTFAWRLAVHAGKAAGDGSTTNALAIPLAPFGYLAAASCLLSAGIALLFAIRGEPPDHEE